MGLLAFEPIQTGSKRDASQPSPEFLRLGERRQRTIRPQQSILRQVLSGVTRANFGAAEGQDARGPAAHEFLVGGCSPVQGLTDQFPVGHAMVPPVPRQTDWQASSS